MTKNLASAVLLSALILLGTACAADSFVDSVKEAGRSIGHATRDVTREIGHATRDTTRAIGHTTRDATHEIGKAFSSDSDKDNQNQNKDTKDDKENK